MPAYDAMMLGEKTAVIFDVGNAYTKCGFAGETGPRFILPTRVVKPDGKYLYLDKKAAKSVLREFFVKFFHFMYYKHLLVNPKDRRVLVVESVCCPEELRNVIADVLFTHFEVPSALFAPTHLLSLFTLGLSTGLVLDCGYQDALVIPVYEGFTLLGAWQSGPLGSRCVHEKLKVLLTKHAGVVEKSASTKDTEADVVDPASEELAPAGLKISLPEDTIEDIKVRACFVSPISRARKWNEALNSKVGIDNYPRDELPEVAESHFSFVLDTKSHGESLSIPYWIREAAPEVLFTSDLDGITLATLILNAIKLSPVDVRRRLASNIVLVGGTCSLPGFTPRLLEELNDLVGNGEFDKLTALKGQFMFHKPPSKSNYTAWLGGAIFGALECLPGRSMSRDVFLEKRSLPDWTTTIDTDNSDRPDRT